MVREAIEIFERLGVHLLAAGEFAHQALGPPRDRSREVEVGGRGRPARQNERIERPQRSVHRVDLALEALDLRSDDTQGPRTTATLFGGAQIGAEVEQVILDAVEHLVGCRIGVEPGDPDRCIGLVDGAVCGNAQRMFRDASAVAEGSLAGIAAAGVDPSEPHHYECRASSMSIASSNSASACIMTRDCISLFDRRGSPPRSIVATPKPSTASVPSIASTSRIVKKTVMRWIWPLQLVRAR